MTNDTCGWDSDFETFHATKPRTIRESLEKFVRDFSPEQVRAWNDSIPRLQREAGETYSEKQSAKQFTSILEYQLPLEGRRPDAVMLLGGAVAVLELKGKERPSQGDLDQAAAYGRDLRAYHRDCHKRPVYVILVPTRASRMFDTRQGVFIASPDTLHKLFKQFSQDADGNRLSAEQFLDSDAYCPLPSLVQAARELFLDGDLRRIHRARALTDPAVDYITKIAKGAAKTKTRHLALVTGVPGSGKTLVGLRMVHSGYLDELSVPRRGGRPTVPGLFLSGNGPLVEVLQYELRAAGGGGRTFVRAVKSYLNTYAPRPDKIPPEHVLVFDEAQRAFTKDKVQDLHDDWPEGVAKSEPAHYIEICGRIPEWALMVGLIGGGQEIHLGEEGGIVQWREAIEESGRENEWTVHAPSNLKKVFEGSNLNVKWDDSLDLDTELRFHLASELHRFVECLLDEKEDEVAAEIAKQLWKPGGEEINRMCLWVTRDLDAAKRYLRDRYGDNPHARYGIVASSRDKLLESFGIDNTWRGTKVVRLGPWYGEGPEGLNSCRRLASVVTEFGAQGLELDMSLLAWGGDLVRKEGKWSNGAARGYRRGSVEIKNPFRLRQNAYRVLLTRGRDGVVVFVPPTGELDETHDFLLSCGFRTLP